MPDVGIVMPVYTQKPEFLAAALQSILNQTYDNYVLIIVIDGDANMHKLCQAIVRDDPRVQYVLNETNQGVAKALNRGFDVLYRNRSIEYLTWISSDNLYSPYFIEVLRRALHTSAVQVGLVYSSFRTIDQQGTLVHGEKELALQRHYQSRSKEHLLDSCIVGVSFMYRARDAKQIEGYGLEPVEDYDYWLRLTEHCDTKYVPIELMDYRTCSELSISATLQSKERHRYWRFAYHTARYRARSRRGIPSELTIVYALAEADEKAVARLESLYEQSYSNYQVFFIDLSADGSATEVLSQIAHPTFAPIKRPGMAKDLAVLSYIEKVRTPYTMVLGPEPFGSTLDLEVLLNEMSKAPPHLSANYYTDNRLVGYRSDFVYYDSYEDQLFRTEKLVQLLRFQQKEGERGS
ncbi:glycosyltransferase [Paenibacillus sp. YYML68]|uniref:glycosyltransferase family 2 protein n=1 Tax=Paenibacillus sp. YYML68 TaxID=2909250 RepID=UPI00249123CD|nr:glycosyltransferase [Paenibacillus sp. YYML68]